MGIGVSTNKKDRKDSPNQLQRAMKVVHINNSEGYI